MPWKIRASILACSSAGGVFVLVRSFRYYGKKRGHRRTGSPALGSVGEAVFFAVLLLLGCGGLVQTVLRR